MKKIVMFCTSMVLALTTTLMAQSGWTLRENPLGIGDSAMLGKVQFVSPSEAWISGSRGTLLHSTDAGSNWNIVEPFPEDTVWSGSDPGWSMSWIGAQYGWKLNNVGLSGTAPQGVVIHRTADAGNSWDKVTLSAVPGDMGVKIQFVDPQVGFVLIYNFQTSLATSLRSSDGGDNWTSFNGAGIFYFVDTLRGWAFSSPTPGGVDPPFQIYHTTDGGQGWDEQFYDNTAGAYNDIYFSDANHGWIVGDNGKVLRTVDGGANWEWVTNSGITPTQRTKTVFFLDDDHGWIPSKTTAGVPYIQYTNNGGSSWTTQQTSLGDGGHNAIFSISFATPNRGIFVADAGRIYTYSNVTGIDPAQVTPRDLMVLKNYPNPFNPSTTISYTLPVAADVTLSIYDIRGISRIDLVSSFQTAGTYELQWDGLDDMGNQVAAGVYFLGLQSTDLSTSIRLVVLK